MTVDTVPAVWLDDEAEYADLLRRRVAALKAEVEHLTAQLNLAYAQLADARHAANYWEQQVTR